MNTTLVINKGVKKLIIPSEKFYPRIKAPFWVAVQNVKKSIITVDIFEHNAYNLSNCKWENADVSCVL